MFKYGPLAAVSETHKTQIRACVCGFFSFHFISESSMISWDLKPLAGALILLVFTFLQLQNIYLSENFTVITNVRQWNSLICHHEAIFSGVFQVLSLRIWQNSVKSDIHANYNERHLFVKIDPDIQVTFFVS